MRRELIVNRLRKLGFSEYEAQAYAALLEVGEATADEISRRAGVPLPRVYGVLDSLSRRGFVEILPGRPKRYRLKDPREAGRRLLEERRRQMEEELRRLEELIEELERLLEPQYLRLRYEIKPEELLLPLDSLEEAERRTKEVIRSAQEEILIMTNTFSWAPKVLDELREARARGVSVRVLMRPLPSIAERVRQLKEIGAEVRRHPAGWYPVRGTIVDGRRAVFVIWASPPIKGVGVIYRPHYTENPGMIRLLLDVFNMYWERAPEA